MNVKKVTNILRMEFINASNFKSVKYHKLVDVKRDKVRLSKGEAELLAVELKEVRRLFLLYFKTTVQENSDTHLTSLSNLISCAILKKYVLLGRQNKCLIENLERGFNVTNDSLLSANNFINIAFEKLFK